MPNRTLLPAVWALPGGFEFPEFLNVHAAAHVRQVLGENFKLLHLGTYHCFLA
jgi:hypothetical protein